MMGRRHTPDLVSSTLVAYPFAEPARQRKKPPRKSPKNAPESDSLTASKENVATGHSFLSHMTERIKSGYRGSIRERRTKNILFYRNGDRFFKGKKVRITPHRYLTFHELLTDLTKSVSLPYGVRKIYTPEGQVIENIDALEDGKAYVCASFERFKQLKYGVNALPDWSSNTKKPAPLESKNPIAIGKLPVGYPYPSTGKYAASYSKVAPPAGHTGPGSFAYPGHRGPQGDGGTTRMIGRPPDGHAFKPRLVKFIKYGSKPRKTISILLNKRTVLSFEHLLDEITDAFDLPLHKNQRIRKLYTTKGREIRGVSDFFRETDSLFIASVTKQPLLKVEIQDILEEIFPGNPPANSPEDRPNRARRKFKERDSKSDSGVEVEGPGEIPTKSASADLPPLKNHKKDKNEDLVKSSKAEPKIKVKAWASQKEKDEDEEKIKVEEKRAEAVHRKKESGRKEEEEEEKNKVGELTKQEWKEEGKKERRKQEEVLKAELDRKEAELKDKEEQLRRKEEESKRKEKERREEDERIKKEKKRVEERKKEEDEKQKREEECKREEEARRKDEEKEKEDGRKNEAKKEEDKKKEETVNKMLAEKQIDEDKNSEYSMDSDSLEEKTVPDQSDDDDRDSSVNLSTEDSLVLSEQKSQIEKDNKTFTADDSPEFETKTDNGKVNRFAPAPREIVHKNVVLEKYDVGIKIGDGNFAEVHKASRKSSGKTYAMKIVYKSKLKGKEHMIANEIGIMHNINHKNIVRLYEEYETQNHIYLLMEYVSGGDLFDAITESIKFTEADGAQIVGDMARALKYLHDLNVVHRDLKPENLLVSKTSSGDIMVKLADFGLAMEVLEPIFTVCGTPTYVAPEILTETGYGLEVDMWATGVITYILLCGFPPFRSLDRDQEELFDLIQAGDFEFISPYWDNISLDAKDLVNHLLVVYPKRRYTAEQVLRHPWIVNHNMSADLPNLQREVSMNLEMNFEGRKSAKSRAEGDV